MKKHWSAVLLMLLFCFVTLHAEEFWNKKQPAEWSPDELNTLLTKSPWAKEAKVSFEGSGPGGGRPGGTGGGGYPGGRGGSGRSGGGIGMPGGGGYPGGMGRRSPGTGFPGGSGGGRGQGGEGRPSGNFAPPHIVVRWESALPVKQALERSDTGDSCSGKEEPKAGFYVICATGFRPMRQRPERPQSDDDAQDARRGPDPDQMRQALMEQTWLRVEGQSLIYPEDVQVVQKGKSQVLLFTFARDGRIEDNKELEFVSKMGPLQFKTTFKLKEMKYRGRREL